MPNPTQRGITCNRCSGLQGFVSGKNSRSLKDRDRTSRHQQPTPINGIGTSAASKKPQKLQTDMDRILALSFSAIRRNLLHQRQEPAGASFGERRLVNGAIEFNQRDIFAQMLSQRIKERFVSFQIMERTTRIADKAVTSQREEERHGAS